MDINSYLEDIDKRLGGTASVGFFGMGRSNLALISQLDVSKRHVTVRSDKEPVERIDGVAYITCEVAREKIHEDVLFLSPSVRRETLDTGEGTVLTSDCELFFQGEKKRCICISGSDGKSTTTALAACLLSTKFDTVHTVGNIGIPFATVGESKDAIYVCELSSFNLRYFTPPSERCLLTNITPNHLDWHKDFNEYRAAKLGIADRSEQVVLNADSVECMHLADKRRPFAVFSSKRCHGELIVDFAPCHTVSLYRDSILLDGEAVARVKSIRLSSPHNLMNAMGAIALCAELCDRCVIEEALHDFAGLPHRCSLVGEAGGVMYIDSSIDTTPSRTAATLSAISHPTHLILGGRGKGLSLEPMRGAICKGVKRISIYSEARADIEAWLDGCAELKGIPRASFSTFEEAVMHASHEASRGTVVLLSPAHTAYGEFRDYAERGDVFAEIVKKKILI